MRLDPRRSDVAQSRPHRAGSPVAIPAVAVSIHVRPIRAAAGCAVPAAALVEGVREHVSGGPRVAQPTPHPCGWVLTGLRLGARLEVLLRHRRIHAARPSSVRRCSKPPASCGLPCGHSCGGRFYSCAAHPGRRGLRIAGGIHAASVLAANTTRSAASLPPTFSAGWERPSLQEAPMALDCARRLHWRRPRNRRHVKLPRQEAAGALVFARDASRHGCRRIRAARGPEARYDQAHPTPELPKASRQDCRRV